VHCRSDALPFGYVLRRCPASSVHERNYPGVRRPLRPFAGEEGLPTDFERPVERLIRSRELHVGLRDFDDDVPIGDTSRPELDVNFEIWAVLTDKCFST